MEKYVAEQFVPQEYIVQDPELESRIIRQQSEKLMVELIGKYKPGQLVAVQLPHQIPRTCEWPINGTNIRMVMIARELVECKNCEHWTGRDWYDATLDDHTRGTCCKNWRQEAIFSPPEPVVTFANDFCSSAKRREGGDVNGEGNRNTEPDDL